MNNLSIDDVIGQLVAVLDEGFEHPPKPFSYFLDNQPDAGLLNTLSKLTADLASRKTGGTSIASHVHHLQFALMASSAWISGNPIRPNWAESWCVEAVTNDSWGQLIDGLRTAYLAVRRSIESNAAANVQTLGGAIAAIAHSAYHIGAIRQKVAAING